jgi:hypothetical protein
MIGRTYCVEMSWQSPDAFSSRRVLASTKPLKILHITPSFAPAWGNGGTTESLYQLCRHVAEEGCETHVLTIDADKLLQMTGDANEWGARHVGESRVSSVTTFFGASSRKC